MIPLFCRTERPWLIGVVHLLPLPGAPRPSPGISAVIARARADAAALALGGCDAIIVENLGDAPFFADAVDSATVAAMTRIALAVREAAPELPLGINILRNDALSAMAVAAAVEAAFVRVNVLSGTMVTDQGVITGRARELLQLRNRLGSTANIAADVLVKHDVPLGALELEDAARDTFLRAGADALIVSGHGTGLPLDAAHLDRVRVAAAEAPLWAGSGTTPERWPELRGRLDAAIVGTWLHHQSQLSAPIDADRVAELRRVMDR